MSELQDRRVTLERSSWQFSLGSLLLVMIWVSAGLGLTRLTPWLGVPYVLATLPAVIRTWRYTRRSEIGGQRLNNRTRVRVFLQSLQIVVRFSATSVAIIASVLGVACVWTLVAGIWSCSHLTSVFAHLTCSVNWLLRRITPVGTRWAKMAFRAFSRRRYVVAAWGAILLACAVLTVGSSIALAALVAALLAIEFVVQQISKARAPGEHLGRSMLLSATSLIAADRKLVRQYLGV